MSAKITVAGQINDPMFHKSMQIARHLEQLHPEQISVQCEQFFETQWMIYLKKISNELKGVFYDHDQAHPLIYLNGADYIGDADQFSKWALFNFNYIEKDGLNTYNKLAVDCYKQFVNQSTTRQYACIKFQFEENKEEVSQEVVFELFSHIAPKTCENFLQLCQSFERNSNKIGYAGTEVHRIVRGMYLQMGRIVDGEGTNSIYEAEFADESFHVKHTEVGLLGMCKRSGIKHSNESQFYITLGAPLAFLDNENVVFGRVISGMDTLSRIGQLETLNEKSVYGAVKITESGKFTVSN